MVTHLFDEFDVEMPKIHPATGDLLLTFTDPDSNQRWVFPMAVEDGEAYWNAIGQTLGKNGAKIVLPTNAEVKDATRTR